MNQFNTQNVGTTAPTDAGLASFLKGTYRYMAMAMGVTAVVAFFTGQAVEAGTIPASLIWNPVTACLLYTSPSPRD